MAHTPPDRFPAEDPPHPEIATDEAGDGVPDGITDGISEGLGEEPGPGDNASWNYDPDGPEDPDLNHDLDRDLDPGSDPDSDPGTQPSGRSGVSKDGVSKDMATLALDPRHFEAGRPADRSVVPGMAGAVTGAMTELTDADIMVRVREGDDSCFNYLIVKYQKPIMNFMFRMVHNQAVAEELAQEVFLRVYRSRHTYRAEAKFTTWLYRIATNLGVNHARDTKYERAAQNVYLDEPDAETGSTPDLADSTPTVEHDLVRNERFRAIRQHVTALPERQRTAVLMHKFQGMDYKQIGEVLKLSESATKSLLFRAYQTLRERLKDFV